MKFLFLNLFLSLISFGWGIGSTSVQNDCPNQIEFTIALKQNNVNMLTNLLNKVSNPDSPAYGNYLSQQSIQDIVSPNDNEVSRVTDWLEFHNMRTIVPRGDNVFSRGCIQDVNRLFDVDLQSYKMNNRTVFRSDTDYTIPQELTDIIVFVEGISNRFYTKNRPNRPNRPEINIDNSITSEDSYSGKEVIYRLYNVSNVSKQTSISLCSIEYQGGSGFSQDDLTNAEAMNGNSKNSVKNIVGNDGYPDTESQLDIQMMGITVPNVDLWFWDDNNWLYSLATSMNAADNIPDVISMSWGWSESDQCSVTTCTNETSKQYVDRVNIEYVKLGLRGVTITVASGDAGAPGRTNEGCNDNSDTVHAVFPGSSPWVTSVGATFVVTPTKNVTYNWTTPLCQNNSCATGNTEYVTNFNYTGWTAGGGISNYTDRRTIASWQDDVVTKYLNSGVPLPLNFDRNGRAYPDIAVIGHYCPVLSGGFMEGVDGTSCSSPIFASLVAILNEHQVSQGKARLGFVNPVLYKMYNDNPAIFTDYTSGNNWATEGCSCPERNDGGSDFGYSATTGYDPVYGLGTPNIGLMKEWLDSHTQSIMN